MITAGEITTLVYFLTHMCLLVGTTAKGASVTGSTLWQHFKNRPFLYLFFIIHIINMSFEVGMIVTMCVNEYSRVLGVGCIVLHVVTRIITSVYVYGMNMNEYIFAIAQLFDLEIYVTLALEPNIKTIDTKYDQIFRVYAVLQNFPLAIIQTYLFLVADPFPKLGMVSIIFSHAMIIISRVHKDGFAMNVKKSPKANYLFSLAWCMRLAYRITETIARILLIAFGWYLYETTAIAVILFIEWSFFIYNYYAVNRLDPQHDLVLHPIVADYVVSNPVLDTILPSDPFPKQQNRLWDLVDWLQGWYLAWHVHNPRCMRRCLRHKPLCSCKREMDEYWVQLGINHKPQVQSVKIKQAVLAQGSSPAVQMVCSKCQSEVSPLHYFRCPTFLESPYQSSPSPVGREKNPPLRTSSGRKTARGESHLDIVTISTEHIENKYKNRANTQNNPPEADHGRFLCYHCGYAGTPILPFLLAVSRNIFTYIWLSLLLILKGGNVKCHEWIWDCCGCPPSIEDLWTNHNNVIFVFVFGMSCHVLYPIILGFMIRHHMIRINTGKSFGYNEGDLVSAAKRGEWEAVLDWIARRREYAIDLNEIDRDGKTAASYAAIRHAFPVLRQLQQCGADMKHSDINGVSVAKFLNQPGEDGLTATTHACKMGKVSDLHLAIFLGANLSAFDGNDMTPLMFCAKEGDIECTKALLEHEIDLNQQNNQGTSAVMLAAAYGRKDCVELLCNKGANVLLEDNRGKKAIDYAFEGNETDIAKILHNYMKSTSELYKQQSDMKKEERHFEIIKKFSSSDIQKPNRDTAPIIAKDMVPDSIDSSLMRNGLNSVDKETLKDRVTVTLKDRMTETLKDRATSPDSSNELSPNTEETTEKKEPVEVPAVPEIPATLVADDAFD